MCHLVLLLPVFALPVFWLLPPAVATVLYAAVAAISLVLYLYTFKAMRKPRLNGAEAMIVVQQEELGQQIHFNGQKLADIITFVHHAEEQKKFLDADIAPKIKALMKHTGEEEGDGHEHMGEGVNSETGQ